MRVIGKAMRIRRRSFQKFGNVLIVGILLIVVSFVLGGIAVLVRSSFTPFLIMAGVSMMAGLIVLLVFSILMGNFERKEWKKDDL